MPYLKVTSQVIGRLFTVSEVAAKLGISEGLCRRLMARGDLKCVRIGRCVRVPLGEIDRIVPEIVEGHVARAAWFEAKAEEHRCLLVDFEAKAREQRFLLVGYEAKAREQRALANRVRGHTPVS